MRNLVVCVGAQKAATSSLHSLMSQHSQVSVTNIKETGFFFRDEMYSKGFDWYQDEFFTADSENKILFEADPNYMCFPVCLDRLKECGHVSRVIVMLRNPVQRVISSYMMMQRYELEGLDFNEAIKTESVRINEGVMERETFNYIERSMYGEQIRNILKRFSRDQVLFILFEDFIKNQPKEFSKIQTWLGLDVESYNSKKENASFAVKSRLINKLILANNYRWLRYLSKYLFGDRLSQSLKVFLSKMNNKGTKQNMQPISKEVELNLYAVFHNDIIETEKLTGLDLSRWLRK